MPLATYLSWLTNDALPVWLASGFDPKHDLFYEKLHLDGRPDAAAVLRSRTQARQIHVYARAAELGFVPRDPSLQTAIRAADRLHAVAWAPDGRPGWVHLLKADGSIVDARRDLYDQAFLLFALTWLAKVSGLARFTDWVEETLDYIDAHLTADHHGWLESDRRELPRRQNPHMHLLEASLALYETTGNLRHLTRADALVGLFERFFFDSQAQVLREFFGPAWERDAVYGSQRLEPGHHLEWCWLLRRHGGFRDIDSDAICEALFNSGLRFGLCQQSDGLAIDNRVSDFLLDETDDDGSSPTGSRRLWPQTEYLRCLIEQGVSLGDPVLISRAHDLADRLLETYLTATPRGTWRDRFDAEGKANADHIPASTLYHLFTAGVEIHHLQQRL
jgi:mannose/cellobiose epimerase-like protein (N-acyl-D-glucosamine 2-epimerase family)